MCEFQHKFGEGYPISSLLKILRKLTSLPSFCPDLPNFTHEVEGLCKDATDKKIIPN